jgi:hypothetical protein
MQGQQVCVYNQTNECFLSLGATRAENPFVQLKRRIFARGAHYLLDEGCWYARPYGLHTLGVFARRDLVYLDNQFRVLHLIESFPVLCAVPKRSEAASLLTLPVHTIASSQTRTGNQLVICAPEEMELRLRSLRERSPGARTAQTVMDVSILPQHGMAGAHAHEHRGAPRSAADGIGGRGAKGVHVIRDISATGLYLVTQERWPVGSRVRMSLQRTGPDPQGSHSPITLDMRVTRWGSDGVGLEFAGPPAEHAELASMHVC